MTMSPLPAPLGGSPAKKERGSLIPARVKPAVVVVGSFGLLLVVIQLVNSAMSYRLDSEFGILPRTWDGLVGVLTAPLLHGSWGHLLSNLVPLLIFGVLIMLSSTRQFVAVTVLVWLVSGLVFGWLAYLVTRGVFTRNLGQIAIGVVLLVLWGGVFWTGIIKVAVQDINQVVTISWQGHLFGAIGGVLAAFLVARADGPRRKQPAQPVLTLPR